MKFATPSTHGRGVLYLVAAVLLAGILLGTMLWPNAGSTAGQPCQAGTAISGLLVAHDATGGSHLIAMVGPASGLNAVVGSAPGCQALYLSDDGGASWAAVFSHASEGPVSLAEDARGHTYVLATTVRFPLYLAGNMYRNDDVRDPWLWQRVSPQQRTAVPSVAITAMAVAADGSLVALAAGGDGGALLRSTDYGTTWQPIVVPHLLSVSSIALLGTTIAVTPASYVPRQSPGRVSENGGRTWAAMAALPDPPARADLTAALSVDSTENVLVLDLMTGAAASGGVTVARYVSANGGRTWQRDHCASLPTAGCAGANLWAQTSRARYVLYHRRLFRNVAGQGWRPMGTALPVDGSTVEQLVAAAQGQTDTLYLVTRAAIWRLDPGGSWATITASLPLLVSVAPAYTMAPPGWPAAT